MAGCGRTETGSGVLQGYGLTMKILFDHGTPAPLRNHLREHLEDRSAEKGWELLGNGELIRRAHEEGYEVIVTTDQSIRYQQNLSGTGLAIVVLLSTAWPRVRNRTAEIRAAIETARPGESGRYRSEEPRQRGQGRHRARP